MCQSLSLWWSHCYKCGAKCCISGKTIGAPIVSKGEKDVVLQHPYFTGFYFQKEVLPNGKYYYIPTTGSDGSCWFLTLNRRCLIQDVKFNDCKAYPIKAIRKGGEIIFIIDIHCPAARHLTPEFISAAKEVALQSLNRWDSEVYQHWLDHYIAWVKDAMELEEYLKLNLKEKHPY